MNPGSPSSAPRVPAPDAAAAPGAAPAGGPPWLLAAAGALIMCWFALIGRFGAGIYALLGPFSVGVTLLVATALRARLRDWLRPTRRSVMFGVLFGLGMTLATYPLYALACAIAPRLRVDVAVLYAAARGASLAETLPWLVAIVVAEELLWRGALLELLSPRISPRGAMAISIATYTFAQAGTGSPIVALLALACGTLWTLQRQLAGSLLSPLIAHLIWTPTLILLAPLDAWR